MTAGRLNRIATAAAGIAFAGVLATQAHAHSQSTEIPEIEWDTTLAKFQFDDEKFLGQRFTAKCMPAQAKDMGEAVYGTDVYSSKSAICRAAMHTGLIDKQGGVVTVQLNPGAGEYTGSQRHGVATESLPATPRSMVFVTESGDEAADRVRRDNVPSLRWDTKFTATGLAYRQLVGQQFVFSCPAAPANMKPRRVVGTDSYAFHSMVCRAAVHAGKITTEGGLVTVQLDPGKKKLVGSIRHGIESKDGPGGDRTLSFVDAPSPN